MITNNENDRRIIKETYDYFNKNAYSIQEMSIDNIYVCNDIQNDINIFLNNDHINKQCNGHTIYKNAKKTEDIIILVELRENMPDNIITLFHEFIHVYDIKLFLQKYHTLDNDYFYAYTVWSEFHACYISEKLLIEYYKNNGIPNIINDFLSTKEEQINEILKYIRIAHNREMSIFDKMNIFAKLFLFGYYEDCGYHFVYEFIDHFYNDLEDRIKNYNITNYLYQCLENDFNIDTITYFKELIFVKDISDSSTS